MFSHPACVIGYVAILCGIVLSYMAGAAGYPLRGYDGYGLFVWGTAALGFGFFLVLVGVIAGAANAIIDRITMHPEIASRYAAWKDEEKARIRAANETESAAKRSRLTHNVRG